MRSSRTWSRSWRSSYSRPFRMSRRTYSETLMSYSSASLSSDSRSCSGIRIVRGSIPSVFGGGNLRVRETRNPETARSGTWCWHWLVPVWAKRLNWAADVVDAANRSSFLLTLTRGSTPTISTHCWMSRRTRKSSSSQTVGVRDLVEQHCRDGAWTGRPTGRRRPLLRLRWVSIPSDRPRAGRLKARHGGARARSEAESERTPRPEQRERSDRALCGEGGRERGFLNNGRELV